MTDRSTTERPATDASVFDLGDWRVDPSRCTLSRDDVVRHVQPRVMDFLCYLALHPQRTVTRQELLAAVWGDVHVVNDVVWRCVSLARVALADDRDQPRYIETVPRRGYRLVAPVRYASRISERPVADGARPRAGTTARLPGRRIALSSSSSPIRLPFVAATAVGATAILVGIMIAPSLWSGLPGGAAAGPRGGAASDGPRVERTASDYTQSGREYYSRFQPDDLRRAAVQFQRALALQPAFAPALAGLADTYVLQSAWGTDHSLGSRALAHARRAIAIDPMLPEAHRSLGLALLLNGRVEASLAASRRALELRPGWAAPMHNIAAALSALGRLDAAVLMQRQVVATDSRSESWGRLAWLYRDLGMKDRAEAAASEALQRQPFEAQATAVLAALALEEGHADEAWGILEPALGLSPRPPILLKVAALTHFSKNDLAAARRYLLDYAAGEPDVAMGLGNVLLAALDQIEGHAEEALARLSEARDVALAALGSGDERWEPRFELAVWHAAAGDVENARRWLRRAFERGFRDHRLLAPDSPLAAFRLPAMAGGLPTEIRSSLASRSAELEEMLPS